MKSFRFSILDIGLFIISIIFTACAVWRPHHTADGEGRVWLHR